MSKLSLNLAVTHLLYFVTAILLKLSRDLISITGSIYSTYGHFKTKDLFSENFNINENQ